MGSVGTAAAGTSLEDYEPPIGVEGFRKLGYEVVDMICDYMTACKQSKQQRVMPDIKPGYLRPLLPDTAPEQPDAWHDVKQDFYSKILPGATHWQSPRFFAWFAGNTSPPSIMAEMLIAAMNMIGFSWQSSPVSTELEMVVMDWLAKLCGLPEKFICNTNNSNSSGNSGSSSSNGSAKSGGGVIQTTSSEAVLLAMLAARARALQGQPADASAKLVAYGSDQAHLCFQKAAIVAGIQHVRVLKASAERDFALDPKTLEDAIQQDLEQGLQPFFASATIGTTSSCAVDPVGELGKISRPHGVWLHVDAAWAGSAAILPEQRHWFEGLSEVDSFSFSCHKWLCVNFDCAAMWLEDTKYLRQALSLTPAYLQGVGNVFDYKDWQIPLGRRFKSLKLWFVLRMYGAQKLQEMIRHHIALGQWFAEQLRNDARFEVAAPPRFGLTCFRLKGVGAEGNKQLIDAVNATGVIFIIGTELGGQFTIRFAVGNAHTQLEHVQHGWEVIKEQAAVLLATSSAADAAAAPN